MIPMEEVFQRLGEFDHGGIRWVACLMDMKKLAEMSGRTVSKQWELVFERADGATLDHTVDYEGLVASARSAGVVTAQVLVTAGRTT